MDKFADICKNSAKLEIVISIFLTVGVHDILNGDYDDARKGASIIRFFTDALPSI